MNRIHGLLAEFDTPEALLRAARAAREAGFLRMDAYAPMPVAGLAEALGFRFTRLPAIVLGGGLAGALLGFLLQYWVSVSAYPLNVGGRPHNSWPAFIVITFETAILVAALSAVVGMLALNGLPRPHHPLFAVPAFARATRDRFFLCIEARDPKFDVRATRRFLESLEPREVVEVEE
ncbi:MAG: DUF3341 domain-containing protein [Planctomycetes bacterium]|nr:DUF3341 domain-containing protein [Planctomycetota bacterium]